MKKAREKTPDEENMSDEEYKQKLNEEYARNKEKKRKKKRTQKKKRQKSIVSKYVRTALMTICAGLLLCGIIIMAFAKSYFDNETWNVLYNQANTASAITTQNTFKTRGTDYAPDIQNLKTSYSLLGNANQNEIILTDMSGLFMLNQDGIIAGQEMTLPQEIYQILLEGKGFTGYSKLGGYYQNNHYIIGLPVYNDIGDMMIGFIIVTSSGQNLVHFMTSILQIFLIASIAVIAFTFTITTITTEKMLGPINEVSEVAKSYGKADFSKRVSVDPNSFDELNQLSITFNNMANSLALHEKSTRSFVANISHELKTPMTTIGGFVDGILDGTIQPEDQKKYLQIVSNEIKRLSRLTQSMLNLSKIEAGEMPMNPISFDINEVVIQVLLGFEKRIEEKQIEILNLDPDNVHYVLADKDLIYQVIYNLVDNAVKFVNDGGYLAFYYAESDDMVYVTVRNSGKGLTKEEVNQVFERFYKTDRSRSLDKSGVGLGLFIVKSIMNLHDGKVSVESVEHEYVQFKIALPKGELPK